MGEWITLPVGADPAGATYQVQRIVYCYGERMGMEGSLSLLKITVGVR